MLYELVDMVVDFMKHFTFYGISMWFIFRMISFITIVVMPLVFIFINNVKGGTD